MRPLDHPRIRQSNVSQSSLCFVTNFANSGYPLTLAGTADGYLAIAHITDSGDQTIVDGFFVCDCPFNCELCATRIFAVPNESNVVNVWDIASARQISDFIPLYGMPRCVRRCSYFNDVVAVCSDRLEFFDIRKGGRPIAAINAGRPAFDVGDFPTQQAAFAVCLNPAALAVVDLRRQAVLQGAQPQGEDLTALSFCGQPGGSIVAVGTQKGVWIVDADNPQSSCEKAVVSVGRLFGSRKLTAVGQCAFDPAKFRVIVLQEDPEIFSLFVP
jgi:hypothetical protein